MNNPLSYRLSKSTTVRVSDNAVHLVLRYPLKAIAVHMSWHDVLGRLSQEELMPLDELASLLPGISRQKTFLFLNNLVFKGFLERKGIDRRDRYPRVSVIIPVRNRSQEIGECLASLQQLDFPTEQLEIIVVDDASEDDTATEVEKYPVDLIRLKTHQQASYCRNLGARHARGDILAFIDSDCAADPLWLKHLLPAFDDPTLAAVGGRVDSFYEEKRLDFYEKAKSSLMVSHHAKRSKRNDPFFYVPACNFLVRRHVFLEMGGFDVALTVGEDVDLCWRLQKHDHDIEFWPEGVIYHKHRNRLAAFCKRRFDYGTSEPMLQKMHPEKVKQFFMPPIALGFWLLLILLVLTGHSVFGFMAGLLVIGSPLIKRHRYKRFNIHPVMILSATLRSCVAFAYHLCAFISRYYLVLGFLMLPFISVVSIVVAIMHVIVCLVEYQLKRVNLSLPWFFVFFTLEQSSYQSGVWWGCLCYRNVSCVLPTITVVRNV